MLLLRAGCLLALSTLALGALAACGGDDDDNDATGTAANSSASASPSRSASASPSGSSSPASSASPGGSPSPGASGTASPGSSPGSTSSPTSSGTQPSGTQPAATRTVEIFTPVAQATFEPEEGTYCDTVTPTSPPNSVIGLLQFDGTDAPAGTEVMIVFDGVPGPVEETTAAGGFRVDYGTSKDSACANVEGAELSIVVDGIEYETGKKSGEAAAIRFDIVE